MQVVKKLEFPEFQPNANRSWKSSMPEWDKPFNAVALDRFMLV
jgi:hypothetical protein